MAGQTKQQSIIKEELDKLLRKGFRGQGFIIFENEETGHHLKFELEEDGLSLYHGEGLECYNETLNALKELLNSLLFEESSEFPLEEKNFCVLHDGLYACCGRDTHFLAYLSDRVFRDVFKVNNGYKVKINLEHLSFC